MSFDAGATGETSLFHFCILPGASGSKSIAEWLEVHNRPYPLLCPFSEQNLANVTYARTQDAANFTQFHNCRKTTYLHTYTPAVTEIAYA